MEKLAQAGKGGGGTRPPPFTIYTRTIMLQLRGQICFVSTLTLYVLCGSDSKTGFEKQIRNSAKIFL